LNNKLYAGDLVSEDEFIVDPKLSFEFNQRGGNTSFDIGIPEVFITQESNIPDNTKTIDNFIATYDFQHSGSIDPIILSDRDSDLFEHNDHTSNIFVDFSSMIIAIDQTVPTKITYSTNIFVSN